jgi:hypothetical protein
MVCPSKVDLVNKCESILSLKRLNGRIGQKWEGGAGDKEGAKAICARSSHRPYLKKVRRSRSALADSSIHKIELSFSLKLTTRRIALSIAPLPNGRACEGRIKTWSFFCAFFLTFPSYISGFDPTFRAA